MKKIIVVYHKDCLDGFGAAWAAWRKFGDKADYIGIYPRDPLPSNLRGKEIYFLDVCSDEEQLRRLMKINKKVVVIDHHLSRKEFIKIASETIFKLNHSGAALSWRYFHSRKRIPKLLTYIEDRDLWKFKMPYTRELMASLETYAFDFKLWNKIALDFESFKGRGEYIKGGSVVINYKNKMVESIVARTAEYVIFEKRKALAVNCPDLHSEIGDFAIKNKLASLCIIWYYQSGMISAGLRADGSVNIAELAEKYGGGGHRDAGGFSIKTQPGETLKFPWKKRRV